MLWVKVLASWLVSLARFRAAMNPIPQIKTPTGRCDDCVYYLNKRGCCNSVRGFLTHSTPKERTCELFKPLVSIAQLFSTAANLELLVGVTSKNDFRSVMMHKPKADPRPHNINAEGFVR